MTENAGRMAGGLVLLVALWIGVYWWWPSQARVSFAQADDTMRGVNPNDAAPPAPTPEKPVDLPAQPAPTLLPQEPKLPPPAVVPPDFIRHTVQKDETFETIARRYYGQEGRGSIIAKANPMTDPNRLTPGRVLLVPKDPANIQGVPVQPKVEPQAPEEYTVRDGDTLSGISREVYGESRLWEIIFQANRDQLARPDALKAGQKLRIPPKPAR